MFWNKKKDESFLPDLPQTDLPEVKNPFASIEKKEEDEEETFEKHALPSIPDSSISEKFSQAAIKDAVTNTSETNVQEENVEKTEEVQETSLSSIPSSQDKKFRAIEMKDNSTESQDEVMPSIINTQSSKKQAPATLQISEPPRARSVLAAQKPIQRQKTPIPQPPQYRPQQNDEPAEYVMPKPREPKKAEIFVKIDKFYSAKKALEETKEQLEQIDEILKKIRETKLREEQELETWENELMNAKARIQEVNENIFEKAE